MSHFLQYYFASFSKLTFMTIFMVYRLLLDNSRCDFTSHISSQSNRTAQDSAPVSVRKCFSRIAHLLSPVSTKFRRGVFELLSVCNSLKINLVWIQKCCHHKHYPSKTSFETGDTWSYAYTFFLTVSSTMKKARPLTLNLSKQPLITDTDNDLGLLIGGNTFGSVHQSVCVSVSLWSLGRKTSVLKSKAWALYVLLWFRPNSWTMKLTLIR